MHVCVSAFVYMCLRAHVSVCARVHVWSTHHDPVIPNMIHMPSGRCPHHILTSTRYAYADLWNICIHSTKEEAVQHVVDEVSYINDAEAVEYKEWKCYIEREFVNTTRYHFFFWINGVHLGFAKRHTTKRHTTATCMCICRCASYVCIFFFFWRGVIAPRAWDSYMQLDDASAYVRMCHM
jgi:hypothetical protein